MHNATQELVNISDVVMNKTGCVDEGRESSKGMELAAGRADEVSGTCGRTNLEEA